MPLLPIEIKTHQQLLDQYARVAIGSLYEFSHDIEGDKETLRKMLLKYAEKHGLECPIDPLDEEV
jgi:hypothetical protein